MRFVWLHRLAYVAVVGFFVSGCSGGSSNMGRNGLLPNGPGSSQGTSSIVVQGTITGTGPYLLGHKRRLESLGRRKPQALSLKSVSVTGQLYPSDAGSQPILNTITMPVPTGAYSAKVPFSNVPAHNNEWVILEFTGNAADGSQIALGELAGLINVTASPTNSATLTKATTQTFQVFATLLDQGDLGTFDIDGSPTLAATLAADTAATHVAVDPTTQLFTDGGLITILNQLEPKFERDLTIGTTPTIAGAFTLMRDWTNASEVNLARQAVALNGLNFLVSVQNSPSVSPAWASDGTCSFLSTNPPHIPPGVTIVPVEADACLFANPAGSQTLRNVYGGHLILGATTNINGGSAAFFGGHLSVPGETPGAHTYHVTVAASASTFTVNDPAGFAFGAAFWQGGVIGEPQLGGFFSTQPNYGAALPSDTFFSSTGQISVPSRVVPKSAPYGPASPHNEILVDTFNAWNIPGADMELCGGISCYPLTSSGTLAITRPFADGGNKLAYFNWKVAGKATHIANALGGGYAITFAGPGTATLTSTTPTALEPNQLLNLSMPTMPNDRVNITAFDAANSNQYTGNGTLNFGSVSITMNEAQTVKIKEVIITFAYTGGAGSQTLSNISAPFF